MSTPRANISEMVDTQAKLLGDQRYYIYNQTLPCDEDICNEFKGHRNIVIGEIPPKSFKHGSRSPISRAINAFLNTGLGGTIYCGVPDEGTVKGINFSPYQMDHMRVTIQDVMANYRPPVPPHRWRLEFVPIVSETPSAEVLQRVHDVGKKFDPRQRTRSHVIGTYEYCWCDKDALAAFNNGIMHLDYIAEIIVHPWSPANPLDAQMISTVTKLRPLHEAEDHKVYIRSNASVQVLDLQAIVELTKSEVNNSRLAPKYL